MLKKYRYEVITALCGGIVMVIELIGARMLAPFFGTSLYVWTAIIGVILGALSIGYWYGGRLADLSASDKGLMIIISIAALFVSFCLFIQQPLLSFISTLDIDVRISALIASVFLFAPASILLGITSPYVVKLRLSALSTAGSTIGVLYAMGTLGSIASTFLTGYWLISLLGNFKLGVLAVALLVVVSFIAEHRSYFIWRIFGVVIITLILFVSRRTLPGTLADVDSAYARYQVFEETTELNTMRYLQEHKFLHSAIIVNKPEELVFNYIKAFKQVADVFGSAQRALIIGGGAYTFPSALAREGLVMNIDVVEIDPLIDELAKKYFEYKIQNSISTTHADGRVFLNKNTKKYDLIYIDAFSSFTPPYQLTTYEAIRAMKKSLSEEGVVIINLVARPNQRDPYYNAVLSTYLAVFPELHIYQLATVDIPNPQNLLIIAGNQASMQRLGSLPYEKLSFYQGGRILTDDHAPVEQFIQQGSRL